MNKSLCDQQQEPAMPSPNDTITIELTRKDAETVLRVLKPLAQQHHPDKEDQSLPFAKQAGKDLETVRLALMGQLIGKLRKEV